jgi:NTP pyrophosphatase (non-canonical NTP hydrolase)
MRTASGMNYDQVGGNGLLLNGVMGLNGEAGECIDIVKKHIFQGHELDREHLIEELGDAAWYLAVSCEAVGVTLGEVMQRNVDKLKKRYPDGFDKSRSIKREETNAE